VPILKKKKTSQINNLIMHLKLLEKQKQTNPETSRLREIIKVRAKTNEILRPKKKKQYKQSKKQRVGSLKKLTRSTNL
jgi:hypothetical protein